MTSRLIEELDRADEDPQAGYEPSYRYFVEQEGSDVEEDGVNLLSLNQEHNSATTSDDDLVMMESVSASPSSQLFTGATQKDTRENSPTLRHYRIPKKSRSLPTADQDTHVFISYETEKKLKNSTVNLERSPSPIFGETISPVATRLTKTTSSRNRNLQEKKLRGNSTGMNLINTSVCRKPFPSISPVKEITIPLVKCDSPQGLKQVQRLLGTSPSSLSSPSSHRSSDCKTNGRLWKHTSPPKAKTESRTEELQKKSLVDNHDSELLKESEISLRGENEEEEEKETYKCAACSHCGNISRDLELCDWSRCRRKIDPCCIKTKTKKSKVSTVNAKTYYGALLNDMSSPQEDDDDDDKLFSVKPVLKTYGRAKCETLSGSQCTEKSYSSVAKRKRKVREVLEPECVTISSGSEEENEAIPSAGETTIEPISNDGDDGGESIPQCYSPAERMNTESSNVSHDLRLHFDTSPVSFQEQDNNTQFADISSSSSSDVLSVIPKKYRMKDASGNTPTSRSVVVKKRPSKPIQLIVTQSPSSSATSIIIPMRSIRFGSYEVPSFKPDVIFTEESVILTVTIDGRDITFTINGEDMTRFEIHTKTPAALMNIITTPRVGNLIRDRCNMKHKSMGWFDPGSMVESEKRILMIAFKDPLDLYTFATLSKIFRNIGISNNIDGFFVQLTKDESNDLLVLCRDHSSAIKSQKTNTTLQTTRYQSFEASDAVELDDHSVFSERIVKLCSYPPPPCTGAITITNEDLFCLREGEFLNDVIIDFYLKYLTLNVLSEADRKRTYMFSSFFYKRLTQRVKRIVDSSVTMTLEQRRHERVKTWTRHVDIFEKDFIIVPINESAHWFLAFICFPSKATVPNDDADDDDDNKSSSGNVESSVDNADQKSENPQLPVFLQSDKPDDCSDMESMDSSSQNGDKSMMESDNSNAESDKFNLKQENMDAGDNTAEDTDEKTDSTTPNSWKQYQRPCVLVMDSLMGASRNHTVRQLKDYLVVEWENRKGKSRVFKRENIRGSVVKVPQQNNFSDCGVFLLHYVEMFFKKPLQSFSLPISTLKEWFDGEEIPEKRKFIAKLITQLQTDQKTAKKTI